MFTHGCLVQSSREWLPALVEGHVTLPDRLDILLEVEVMRDPQRELVEVAQLRLHLVVAEVEAANAVDVDNRRPASPGPPVHQDPRVVTASRVAPGSQAPTHRH